MRFQLHCKSRNCRHSQLFFKQKKLLPKDLSCSAVLFSEDVKATRAINITNLLFPRVVNIDM